MAPTLEDIARRAEVAKSTVSLVLNNKPGVSPALKEVVLQAAAELGYQTPKTRNPRPVTLRRPAAPLSIAVVHAPSNPQFAANVEPADLYLHYLDGIRSFAQTANLNLTVITDYREDDTRQLAFHLLHNSKPAFDGLIVMGGNARQNRQLIHQSLENHIPTVALSRTWPDLPISTVGPNYEQQVRVALEYLINLGHRRIAFLASENDQRFDWYTWRLNAYRAMHQQVQDSVNAALVVRGDNGAEAAYALRKQHPDVTAIFAINDERALEAWAGLQALGLQVPQDVSIIGQDNVIEVMGDPPLLTTVGFPHVEVGYLATELLLKKIQHEAISHINLWVHAYLVERHSCDRPAQMQSAG